MGISGKIDLRPTLTELKNLFERYGFKEYYFYYLDDCRTSARFKSTIFCELAFRTLFRKIGLHYPEVCLLGVYERM